MSHSSALLQSFLDSLQDVCIDKGGGQREMNVRAIKMKDEQGVDNGFSCIHGGKRMNFFIGYMGAGSRI